jgi:5-(carboxyamino)imidazole ribonucleotide synthase
MEVARAESLERAVREIGYPAILKSAQLGYDGKGQVRIGPETKLEEAWAQMGAPLGILEGYVDFRLEISVIAARTLDGGVATYAPVENQHRNHILDTTIVPARVKPQVAMRAEAIGQHVATELGLVGIVAVEMFVTQNDEVLVNELAPRPHNSGHWSIDGAITSQFEQFVRAVCGLPLGSTERHSDAVMKNLLGDEIGGWREILAEPGAKLHLYGKGAAKPGRKMGHVTRLTPRRSD